MLLSITTTRPPASDLSFLLHKHPDRHQRFELSFGAAHVYYAEANYRRCTACLLLDVDPIRLVRGKGDWSDGMLDQYVNDRPYVASSFLSVAIAQVFGSALAGRSKERPELASSPLPFTAEIDVLPVRGGEDLLRRFFEPLGYQMTARRHPLDTRFPEWGESPFYSVRLEQSITLAKLLQHLYVLIPVFDLRKHYFIGQDEIEKLFAKAGDWLADHPERERITRRYLARQPGLARQALARLVADEMPDELDALVESVVDDRANEQEQTLHEQRLGAVLSVLRASGARTVVDLGCGEGKLLRELLADGQFTDILGMDVSIRSLENAHRRLKLDRLPSKQRDRIRLHHGALTYRDEALAGFDAAALVEVIEHLDPARLSALERVVFQYARPRTVVVTTPNKEYNVVWDTLPAGTMRHGDHRFEWTRAEFQDWATRVADRFHYSVRFLLVGPENSELGAPSQMAVFESEQQSIATVKP